MDDPHFVGRGRASLGNRRPLGNYVFFPQPKHLPTSPVQPWNPPDLHEVRVFLPFTVSPPWEHLGKSPGSQFSSPFLSTQTCHPAASSTDRHRVRQLTIFSDSHLAISHPLSASKMLLSWPGGKGMSTWRSIRHASQPAGLLSTYFVPCVSGDIQSYQSGGLTLEVGSISTYGPLSHLDLFGSGTARPTRLPHQEAQWKLAFCYSR